MVPRQPHSHSDWYCVMLFCIHSLKHTCGTDGEQGVQTCLIPFLKGVMTKTLWISVLFFASFKTVTHTSYSLAPTLQTLLSMIHYKLHVHFLHYICFPHPYTPINNCKNLSHALMIASSNLTSFSIHRRIYAIIAQLSTVNTIWQPWGAAGMINI